MTPLRAGLGGHPNSRPGELSLDELKRLVILAGRNAGFAVSTEIRVPGHSGTRVIDGKMDCAWFCAATGTWLVAWEFDGRDVRPNHIVGTFKRLGNAKKFANCGALMKVQVLYSLKRDLTPLGRSKAVRCRSELADDVRIVSDEELMQEGGIEQLLAAAEALARPSGLP